MRCRRLLVGALAAALVAPAAPSSAERGVRHLAQVPVRIGGGALAAGSDMAFQGDTLVAGTYQGVGLFELTRRAPYVEQVSFLTCPARRATCRSGATSS